MYDFDYQEKRRIIEGIFSFPIFPPSLLFFFYRSVIFVYGWGETGEPRAFGLVFLLVGGVFFFPV